ncbi:MAG: EamA family transporter [Gammaproteobacteria bacterium]
MNWIAYALLGAVAAGVTAVLSKVGVGNIPSNLAVLIRTGVVIVIAAAIVFARGEQVAFKDVKGTAWLALILSGAATGISWLAYFKALQMAPASSVAPVDKLSLAVTVVLAVLFLGEAFTWKTAVGVA